MGFTVLGKTEKERQGSRWAILTGSIIGSLIFPYQAAFNIWRTALPGNDEALAASTTNAWIFIGLSVVSVLTVIFISVRIFQNRRSARRPK